MTINGEYIEYTTLQGDTWDWIAFQVYADEALMTVLIEANPHVPISPVIAMNTVIAVPVLTDVRPTLNNAQRPPWRAA